MPEKPSSTIEETQPTETKKPIQLPSAIVVIAILSGLAFLTSYVSDDVVYRDFGLHAIDFAKPVQSTIAEGAKILFGKLWKVAAWTLLWAAMGYFLLYRNAEPFSMRQGRAKIFIYGLIAIALSVSSLFGISDGLRRVHLIKSMVLSDCSEYCKIYKTKDTSFRGILLASNGGYLFVYTKYGVAKVALSDLQFVENPGTSAVPPSWISSLF